MPQKEIELPRHLVNKVLHLAQVSDQQEVCGFIGKSTEGKYSCYPVKNIAETPNVRFLMSPEEQINSLKEVRGNNEELFAIYHSHPSAPAIPSASDMEQATYSDAYYLIISLNTAGVLEMRCFKLLHDENIVEINIRMIED